MYCIVLSCFFFNILFFNIRIQKPHCDLETIYKLYVFTKSLSKIANALEELTTENSSDSKVNYLIEKYLRPIHDLDSKFDLYRELIEHVIDIDRLPDVVISAKHDPELSELEDERISIENSAKKLQDQANSSWGSFTDVKLEHNQQWGFIFRTTKGDDEREIRANNPKVRILSLQKVILHFTKKHTKNTKQYYLFSFSKYSFFFFSFLEWITFYNSTTFRPC